MPMQIIRNDIVTMKVDAIVNAANTALKMGSGVCGAIFSAAGSEELQEECNKIGKCNVGEAVITKGYNLPSKYIIHTVGPIWRGGSANEKDLLHNCYITSLELALKNNCESIAFPLISSGIYGYPKDQALQIAISAIGSFLMNNEMKVYLVVYDKNSYILSEKLFSKIERYIDDNYIDENLVYDNRRSLEEYELQSTEVIEEEIFQDESPCAPMPEPKIQRSLKDIVNQLEETFSQMLLRLIDEKGMTDVETYKRANIDRKLFSKIRSNKDYNPKKLTAIAFAIALRLNLDETYDLLRKAGYTLSHSNKLDVIIEFFIKEGRYDINEVNKALYDFDQPTLGS